MTTLTYEEAQARTRLIEDLGYHVELDVTGGGDVFDSVTAVRFGCRGWYSTARTWIRRHWPGTGCR